MAILAIGSKVAASKSVATGKLGYVRGLAPLISSTQSVGRGSLYYKLLSGNATASSWAGAQMTFRYPIDATSKNTSFATASHSPVTRFVPPRSGPSGDVTVQLFDTNMVPRMMITFVSLSAQLFFNAVGSWVLVAPFNQQLWNYLMAGDTFIEVDWRGVFKFGGKCEQPGFQDSVPGATTTSSGQIGPYITMSGADYLGLIANRIAYVDALHSWTTGNKNGVDIESNVRVETAVKYYVSANCGPGALANRQIPRMDMATDLLRGNLITYSVKFSPNVSLNLLDILRTIISSGSGPTGMGISLVRNGTRLTFDVYVPRDLSAKAWFSKQTGNLSGVVLYITDPTCTNALVNGSGTLMVEKVATSRTSWNVVEVYSDQTSETDTNNLNANAQQTLLAGGYGPLLNATVTDTPFLTFGRDYFLGDIVTIEVVPGSYYSDVVTSVSLAVTAGQDPTYVVTPTVGHGGDATSTDQSIIGQLITRIRGLETRIRKTQ
jgi:Siphovirus ReqiPepy6 Gp37-like protein